MFDTTFTTPISCLIALAALAGVAVHDTKIDKLAVTFVGASSALMVSSDAAHRQLSTDPHTHVEKVSIEKSSPPRIMPRHGDQKKHLMQKNVPKGGHSFDGYALPLA